jgi:hypothetical protein
VGFDPVMETKHKHEVLLFGRPARGCSRRPNILVPIV